MTETATSGEYSPGLPDESPGLVEKFADWLLWGPTRDRVGRLVQAYPNRRTLVLDWHEIAHWNPEVAEDILNQPDTYREYLEEALRTLPVPVAVGLGRAHVRFENLPDHYTVSPGEYSPSDRHGDLLAVEGQVAKRTEVKPRVVEAAFECLRCGTLTYIPTPPPTWIKPHECQGCELAGPFRVNYDQSEVEDYQKVLVENPTSAAQGGENADIEVVLTDDLTGHEAVQDCQQVTVVGTLTFQSQGGPQPPQYVDANNVVADTVDYRSVDLSEYDPLFDRVRSGEVTFEDCLESVAPKFETGGHLRDEQVKKAIWLQLFSAKTFDGPGGSHYRGEIHVLLPGDPGVGKSVLTKWLDAVAPKSSYHDGSRTSGPGLSAAIVKDDFSDDGFTVAPGALVRGHRGHTVVDELDKAPSGALEDAHTALEDQIVPVSMAGQQKTLPAETSLLAACNPDNGHFDPARPVPAQLDIRSPLLSRFDLILCMRSKEDRDRVDAVGESMLESWRLAQRAAEGEPLTEAERARIEGPLAPDEMQALVMKGKRLTPKPRDDSVLTALREWFTEQKMALPERYRDGMDGDDGYSGPPLPLTARKLSAARRLAQASARAQLREEITHRDVELAKELVSRTLADLDIPPVANAGVGGGEANRTNPEQISGV